MAQSRACSNHWSRLAIHELRQLFAVARESLMDSSDDAGGSTHKISGNHGRFHPCLLAN